MGSGHGWLAAGDCPSTGGVLNITAAAWTAGFLWWRSGNKKRTQMLASTWLYSLYAWFLFWHYTNTLTYVITHHTMTNGLVGLLRLNGIFNTNKIIWQLSPTNGASVQPKYLSKLLYHTLHWSTDMLLFMVALCNRADYYIFALWFLSFFFLFFPRLISAVGDWMPTILPHMVWP